MIKEIPTVISAQKKTSLKVKELNASAKILGTSSRVQYEVTLVNDSNTSENAFLAFPQKPLYDLVSVQSEGKHFNLETKVVENSALKPGTSKRGGSRGRGSGTVKDGIPLGRVEPEEEFKVKMEFLEIMDLFDNFYGHILPAQNFKEAKVSYDVTIEAPRDLKLSEWPEGFKIQQNTQDLIRMNYSSEEGLQTGGQKGVLYKIENPNVPLLVTAQCPKYKDKIAVSASFSPSFDGHEVEFEGGVFVKIIDVSGSMGFTNDHGERRIDVQRKALKEFVKQIPYKSEV